MSFSKARRLAICGGAALILAGCTATAPRSRIDAVADMAPGRWTATREARAGIDTGWVRRFGDGRLTQLVEESLAANPDLRAAAERVNRAAAVARVAGAAARPQVGAALNGTRQKQNFIGLPIPGMGGGVLSNISESYGAALSVSWEPDLWGRVRAGQSAALADMQADEARWQAARASLAAQVAKAYLALAEANEQVTLAREALEIQESTRSSVQGRFERAIDVGEGGTAAQLRLTQTDVATTRALLAQREGERDQAARQLEILLGRYPSASVMAASLPRVPAMPPAGLPSELLLRRPDILEAERMFAASGRRVDEAALAFYPSFSLTGSAGTQTNELREILNSDFGVWSIGGEMAQPILNGGRLQGNLEAARAEEREALANLQSVVLTAFGEVEQALAAEAFLERRERALAEAARLAVDAAESAAGDYRDGTGDILTLLAAQSRRIDIASQRTTLRRLRLENRVNLHLALGGGYQVRVK